MKRIGFVTCVQLGMSCIEEIYRLGGELKVIFTLEDRYARNKSGRIYLDGFADLYRIPLVKIRHINDGTVEQIGRKLELDWLFIIGWSQIAGKEVLEMPKIGCIGMHPTLLPKGRGRASIPWAILKNVSETGVTLFRLDEGVDTGDIIDQVVIPLEPAITATELYQRVNEAHILLIQNNWERLLRGQVDFIKQDEREATEWPERKPEDGEIFGHMSVEESLRLIRAVTHPYPGAFFRRGRELWRIWSAEKGDFDGIKVADGYIRPIEYEIIQEKESDNGI
ncbi:MAG: methionyl-tRNA formyltransferase [Lachnospiraceae bacterium]|jgi:methionyl-tRNA formyltransferase|nr:methionyl-tRNA formyltransferase [Lachnospiraceae bacterium]